jgi:hypothetical protein
MAYNFLQAVLSEYMFPSPGTIHNVLCNEMEVILELANCVIFSQARLLAGVELGCTLSQVSCRQ